MRYHNTPNTTAIPANRAIQKARQSTKNKLLNGLGVGAGIPVAVTVGEFVTVGVVEGYGVSVVITTLGKGVGLWTNVGRTLGKGIGETVAVSPGCGVGEMVAVTPG